MPINLNLTGKKASVTQAPVQSFPSIGEDYMSSMKSHGEELKKVAESVAPAPAVVEAPAIDLDKHIPQENANTPEAEVLRQFRNQFPKSYDNIPDAELLPRILKKFPKAIEQAKSELATKKEQPKEDGYGFGKYLSETFSMENPAVQAVTAVPKAIAGAVAHPIDTIASLGEGAKGVLSGAKEFVEGGMNLTNRAVFPALAGITGTESPKIGGTVLGDVAKTVSGGLKASGGLFPVATTILGTKPATELMKPGMDVVGKVGEEVGNKLGTTDEEKKYLSELATNAAMFLAQKGLSKAMPGADAALNKTLHGASEGALNLLKRGVSSAKEVIAPKPEAIENIAGQVHREKPSEMALADNATAGLQEVANSVSSKNPTYRELSDAHDALLKDAGEKIGEKLKEIKGKTRGNESIIQALDGLKKAYKGEPGPKATATRREIDSLMKKANGEGLSASEVNRVKQLHTDANSLFSPGGVERPGFSKDAMRDLRSELRKTVEDMADSEGVTGVKEANRRYGDLKASKILSEKRAVEAEAAKNVTERPGLVERVGQAVGKTPGIKQGLQLYKGIKGGANALESKSASRTSILEAEKGLGEALKKIRESSKETKAPEGPVGFEKMGDRNPVSQPLSKPLGKRSPVEPFTEGSETVNPDYYDLAREQFLSGKMFGKRPEPKQSTHETGSEIVKGWGSTPAEIVQESPALSDRNPQKLLGYSNPGMRLLPERGTDMPRSVHGVQSRSKKIELPHIGESFMSAKTNKK